MCECKTILKIKKTSLCLSNLFLTRHIYLIYLEFLHFEFNIKNSHGRNFNFFFSTLFLMKNAIYKWNWKLSIQVCIKRSINCIKSYIWQSLGGELKFKKKTQLEVFMAFLLMRVWKIFLLRYFSVASLGLRKKK